MYTHFIFSFILGEGATLEANPSSKIITYTVNMLQAFPNILSSLFHNGNFDYPMKKKSKHNVMNFDIKLSI